MADRTVAVGGSGRSAASTAERKSMVVMGLVASRHVSLVEDGENAKR
jgi:hypothetical protein